jgi:hypothetical protein
VALTRTDVSEERVAFNIRLKRISELETALLVGSHKSLNDVTSQKTAFFIVTDAKTSKLALTARTL